jgi:hypothetical protein
MGFSMEAECGTFMASLDGHQHHGGHEMPRNENRRRKKLEVRRVRRKEQKRALARFESAGMNARMAIAQNWPVSDVRVATDLWDDGIGYVALARRGRNNQVAYANFLVDVYCLGVKNVALFIGPEGQWHDMLEGAAEHGMNLETATPEYARKLVEGAVSFARSCGLEPHPDWPVAARIFGDIDPTRCLNEFTFGKDGKPFYIAGPFDSPERVQQITVALAKNAGPDHFDYVIPIHSKEDLLRFSDLESGESGESDESGEDKP